ncbi:unnamed protein product [Polarella glacialis]|uniref:Uncharacterized protein n=1 Tax=Polarella glacialis TaxID=89957 RepID=A0A813F6Z7_POLGL|nr:unnamed protein product [Polarella glacialis]
MRTESRHEPPFDQVALPSASDTGLVDLCMCRLGGTGLNSLKNASMHSVGSFLESSNSESSCFPGLKPFGDSPKLSEKQLRRGTVSSAGHFRFRKLPDKLQGGQEVRIATLGNSVERAWHPSCYQSLACLGCRLPRQLAKTTA